ncbi:MAG: hypothetical protein IPK17_37255 [Chloroflexi bacterium]|uniref:hypothetical protein n=1 Tax=Candidatus Flexifilum breve TaxID=3140694 RepID=UPI003135F33B|nr:hypothetical protein [Chloroflexota bacterium]
MCSLILPFLATFFDPDSEWFASDLLATGIVCLFLFASQYARQGHVRFMTCTVSAVLLAVVLYFSYPDMGAWELNFIAFAILPMLLATIFVPLAYSALLMGFLTLGVAVLAYVSPEASFIDLATGPYTLVC